MLLLVLVSETSSQPTTMYNGIGLTTPRGRYVPHPLGSQHLLIQTSHDVFFSGTNGYVQRNLSILRTHETAAERAAAWDVAPPKHREPDEAILEHERKRKVEVKCLELQLKLEDDGYVFFSFRPSFSWFPHSSSFASLTRLSPCLFFSLLVETGLMNQKSRSKWGRCVRNSSQTSPRSQPLPKTSSHPTRTLLPPPKKPS